MKNERNTDKRVDHLDEKLPYSKPALVEYGKVQDLTRGPSGGGDGAPGGRG